MTKEEFVAMFPIGVRISWFDPRDKKWYPGMVVPPDKDYKIVPQHEPRVWFQLNRDKDEESRFVTYKYRDRLKADSFKV